MSSYPQSLFIIYRMEISEWLLVLSPSGSAVGVQCLAGLGSSHHESYLNRPGACPGSSTDFFVALVFHVPILSLPPSFSLLLSSFSYLLTCPSS